MTREEPKKGRTTKQKQNFGRPDPTALKIFTGPHLPTASGVFQQSLFISEWMLGQYPGDSNEKD
jgi:hypothetical protein